MSKSEAKDSPILPTQPSMLDLHGLYMSASVVLIEVIEKKPFRNELKLLHKSLLESVQDPAVFAHPQRLTSHTKGEKVVCFDLPNQPAKRLKVIIGKSGLSFSIEGRYAFNPRQYAPLATAKFSGTNSRQQGSRKLWYPRCEITMQNYQNSLPADYSEEDLYKAEEFFSALYKQAQTDDPQNPS